MKGDMETIRHCIENHVEDRPITLAPTFKLAMEASQDCRGWLKRLRQLMESESFTTPRPGRDGDQLNEDKVSNYKHTS